MVRVLLVDGNNLHRQIFRATLEEKNYEVIEASTLQDAYSAISQENLDLILIDPYFKGLDSLRVIKDLKMIADRTPVVAYGNSDYGENIADHVQPYVVKSCNPTPLWKTVQKELEKSTSDYTKPSISSVATD